MSRLLKNYPVYVTSPYGNRSGGWHSGVDIVGEKNGSHLTDTVLAHSDGTVVLTQTGRTNNKGSKGLESYGNFVKIIHSNGYYTLYAHLKDVYVKVGQKVNKGDAIGYMGNTGNSYGAHTHFEVRNTADKTIEPTKYLTSDLPLSKLSSNSSTAATKFRIGDEVKLIASATYVNGGTIPSWVFDSKLYVREIKNNNQIVISTLQTGAVTGTVYDKYLVLYTDKTTNTASTTNNTNKSGYDLVFDAEYYSNKYSDLKQAYGTDKTKLLNHFKKYGMKEGRQAISTFNVFIYKNRYSDLQKAYGNNLVKYYEHYMKYGYKEGRKGN